uniref:Uncharacterized protein n=1 Tax=Rhizophora mucronata TaxID=61149 RepID=A0A2P2NHL2_RHIMU
MDPVVGFKRRGLSAHHLLSLGEFCHLLRIDIFKNSSWN